MKNNIDKEQVKYVHAGREAFENGLPRTPPLDDPEAVRLWFAGYDIAKRFSEEEVLQGLTAVIQ